MSSKSISLEKDRGNNRKQDSECHKVFLTNLNGQINEQQIENQIRKLFEKYGQVEKLSLKKHKKGYYYFGFLQFPKDFNANEAVKALDQYPLFGKNMKVRQDRQSEGCFKCGSMNHFARQCPQNRDRERRRSYSNQRRNRDRRHPDSRDKYQRRDRDRDYGHRDRERSERHERHDRDRERDHRDRDREREKDRDHQRRERRRRSRSYSESRSSSESSYHRSRGDQKDRKDRRRRSRI